VTLLEPETQDKGQLAILARDVRKSFGRVAALRGIDLEVPWGQFLTILGANGSGKTTLLRTLSTLARPTSGEIRIAGIDPLRNAPAVRRLIGVVTHQPLLYDDLTVQENLAFYARMYGLERPQDKIVECLAALGMERRLDAKARTLSHGMQKRVSIARALLHDPVILLMDEPESGLDSEAVEMLEHTLRPPSLDSLRTVVMTTHNLERGLALGDQVAILADGRIAYLERCDRVTVADVRATYAAVTGATL
jgi:heme exporter protein A